MEAVELQHVVVRRHDAAHALAHACNVLAGVSRVDTHCRDDDLAVRSRKDALGHTPRELVNLLCRGCVGHLHVDRANPALWSAAAQEEVVDAQDALILGHDALDLLGKIGAYALAQDLAERLPEHLKSCLNDERRDNGTHPGLKRDAPRQVDHGGAQR